MAHPGEPTTTEPRTTQPDTVELTRGEPSSSVPTTADRGAIPAAADERWMELALTEARAAADLGEVPVGAVVVCDGVVVGRGHNRREIDHDPLAHAELLALRQAAATLGRWRLSGCTLYVTLEPCPMCAGAVINARLDRLVYSARDPKAGAAGTLYDIPRDSRLNHRAEVTAGVCDAASAALLRGFFSARRKPAAP